MFELVEEINNLSFRLHLDAVLSPPQIHQWEL
jgi:hypothetical protein